MKLSANKDLFKKVRGALIGCAYGDAMGMPTEFLPENDIKELFPDGITTFFPSCERGAYPRSLKAGEVTDDTLNTLFVAEMLIKNKGRINTEAYVSRLLKWYEENPEKSDAVFGPSTRKALSAIKNGISAERAGLTGTTNGAAMKISPLGILYDCRDIEDFADKVSCICIPTHNTGIAIAGACAAAACVSSALRFAEDITEFWDIAEKAALCGEKRGFPFPSPSLPARIERVKGIFKNNDAKSALCELKSVYGTGCETIETIPAVLGILHCGGGNVKLTARLSAEIGGDTDTIGAIACSIAGAFNPDFDEKEVRFLEEVNGIDFDSAAVGLMPYIENKCP